MGRLRATVRPQIGWEEELAEVGRLRHLSAVKVHLRFPYMFVTVTGHNLGVVFSWVDWDCVILRQFFLDRVLPKLHLRTSRELAHVREAFRA